MAAVDGFEVDLETLVQVARGMSQTASRFQEQDVGDLLPSADAVAHSDLAGALREFGDRWTRGMKALRADVNEIGSRLGQAATAYASADRDAALMFDEIAARLDQVPIPIAQPPRAVTPAALAEVAERLG